ncbi:MAG: flagellar hook-basal body complex protein FliE [Planctomycetes bacterium]|nr:flagellar hook-basal body complex protein FliE [Planctomycetota bacterium]MCH9727227.1 flagellar hook-basal body complex protein FliE [Planctomycetota bacterium]MCH9776722.1 flagellar hook-basal body complex protein FliE [Planctomycetota bacterium]MCH9790112.1 flagellar hook-basal body complex protein FliE [Planctomycetota bacterium]MDF1745215.1 flagellar hook-basal body complex protein FliE [Gimesia sp.]
MTNSISQIGNTFLPGIPPVGMNENGAGIATSGHSFKDMMLQSLDNVNQLQVQSQQAIEGGLIGEDITQAEVFSSIKKADLALRMMVQMRNKLLEAYNEIQNMQM